MARFLSFRRVLRLLLTDTYTRFFQEMGREQPKGKFAENRRKSGGTQVEKLFQKTV
jgi:hypothetical protein